jgi:hypothetical protein
VASTDFVYATGRKAINSAALGNLGAATIGYALVSNGYSPNPNTDQYFSSVPGAAIVAGGIGSHLTGVSLSANGSLIGTVPQFLSFISALTVVALVLFVDTGNANTSQLLYYSSSGPGFPFQPQGFNYVVAYDQVAGGFFQ